MQAVGNILEATLKNLGLKKRYHAELAIERWDTIVGDEIAAHSWPVKIEFGVMLVHVNHSAWCHHLSMLKESIIAKTNQFIGEKIVKDIRFQAGYLVNTKNQESEQPKVSLKRQLTAVRFNQDELQAMEESVREIADDRLRKKLSGLRRKAAALNKIRVHHKWHMCTNCQSLCPPEEELCTACRLQLRDEKLRSIRKFLVEAPWLTYEELRQYMECTKYEFDRAKTELIFRLSLEFQQNNGEVSHIERMTLTMLIHTIRPEIITPEIIERTFKNFRRNKHVFASRI